MTFDPILKDFVGMNVGKDITEQISNILSL